MAEENPFKIKQITLTHFEGINSKVADHISKTEELSHGENVRSLKIGYLEKRKGGKLLGNTLSSPSNYGLYYFNNDNSNGLFRITDVSGTVSIYYLNSSNEWTALSGEGTGLSAAETDAVKANGKLFIVNGVDDNRYIESDGISVTTSSDSTGNLYNSPIANKVSYFKDRLYLADYYNNSTRIPTGVMRSSFPLGIAALLSNDYENPGDNEEIKVSDTKYLYVPDTLEVYRGGKKVATINIDEKGQDYIKLNGAPTFESGYSNLYAVDELWPEGTYTGERIFRWATNPNEGIEGKRYDTFKLTGAGGDPVTMFETIGGSLLIANKDNMAIWNGSHLKTMDFDIGCTSSKGYIKAIGSLFFIHYTGIYMMGEKAPKLISSKVDEYIEGATKDGLENATMGREKKSVFCHIGDVTLYKDDNSVDKELKDVVLEYNIQQENWFVHTNIPAEYMSVDKGSVTPDKLNYTDKEDGHVYTAFSSLVDREGVSNEEIPCNLTTSSILLADSFDYISYPKEIIAEIKSGNNIKCFISMDDEEFKPIGGTLRKGCNILGIGEENNEYLRGRKIKISLREMSGHAMKVSQIGITYYESGERELHST